MPAVEIDTPVEKLLYASQGYVLYIVKLFVPYGLSPWYPYPVDAPGYYWIYPLIAAGVVGAAIACRKPAPMLFLGVAWYTVTVAPVLQIMQVGNAMMADRYAYLPSIGILLIMGWRFAAIVELYAKKKAKHLPAMAAGVYILALAAFTFTLAPVWKDGVTLWSRVIERYPTSAKGWFNRGHAYHNQGNFTRAVSDYDRTLEMSPGYPYAWSNRGLSRLFLGDRARALEDFDRELRSRPADPDVRFWRANVLALAGRYDEAAADLSTVLESKPGNFEATVRRGLVYTASREFPKAEADFNAAISARPSDPNLYFNRANVRAGMEQWDGAIADYSSVLRFNPADREAWYARGIAKCMSRDTSAACDDLRRAASLGAVQADTAIAEICIR
jgi:protein O-mannosyl-transferase